MYMKVCSYAFGDMFDRCAAFSDPANDTNTHVTLYILWKHHSHYIFPDMFDMRAAFSILPTSPEDAELFSSDEHIKAISFTGSVPIGWHIRSQAGKKRVVSVMCVCLCACVCLYMFVCMCLCMCYMCRGRKHIKAISFTGSVPVGWHIRLW